MADYRAVESPPLGTKLVGGYELCRFLGAGGMGAVYEAVAPGGRRVAVKILRRGDCHGSAYDELVERFEREVGLTATLDSPHVVSLLHAGLDSELGLPFMVMPLLVGLDLKQLLDRLGVLHPVVAVRIARQACRALECAHRAGIVHRDIKPANVFLDQDRHGAVTVRVLDFGIGRWADEERRLTQTGAILGTPAYMSPEQIRDAKQVDARADVWSLGVVLYYALTGRRPFQGMAAGGQLYLTICQQDAPPLQNTSPWVDPGVAAAVHGTLIRDHGLRCPSAEAFAEALRPYACDSDDLEVAMLGAPTPELYRHRARRCVMPTSWQQVQPTPVPTRTDLSTVERRGSDPLLDQELAARYTLLRRIGTGGMGAVYEAQGRDGNRYAVKVIDSEDAGEGGTARRRFVREAQAAMAIESDHVVQVFEAGTDAQRDLPFIVMELLYGEDLGTRLRREGALMPESAARLFVQACRALAAAHGVGIAHRDIKPSNLFLQYRPQGDVVVKICDFGIAKDLSVATAGETATQLTRTGGLVGSPAYMSPEQAKDARKIDHRSDVWSLGVSLFEALAGEHPWRGRQTVGELIVSICTEPLPHLQDRAPWVPTELAEAVHRALMRDPDERFQSMDELAKALLPTTGGALTLLPDDFNGLPAALMGVVAPRASAPGRPPPAGASSVEAATVASRTERSESRRPRGVVIAGGAIALMGLVGGSMMAIWGGGEGAQRNAATATAGPNGTIVTVSRGGEASAPRTFEVPIVIDPATATVLVDGRPHPLDGGVLRLQAEPGDRLEVIVRDGDQELATTVFVTKSGQAAPDRLRLASASQPTAAPSTAGDDSPPESPTGSARSSPSTPAATAPRPKSTEPAAIETW